MSAQFNIAYFDRLRMARPFEPFQIITNDGQELDVLQPLWFGYNGKEMGVMPPNGRLKLLHHEDIASVRLLTDEEVQKHQPAVDAATRRRTG